MLKLWKRLVHARDRLVQESVSQSRHDSNCPGDYDVTDSVTRGLTSEDLANSLDLKSGHSQRCCSFCNDRRILELLMVCQYPSVESLRKNKIKMRYCEYIEVQREVPCQ